MDWYIGEIKIVSQSYAPKGWQLCNGQIMSVQQNQALFAIIGTTYGGNGVTTFALPDLRGRIPLGFGNAYSGHYALGEASGTESVTITQNTMPAHNHFLQANAAAGNSAAPAGNYFALSGASDNDYSTLGVNTIMATTITGSAGGSQPVNIQQPYMVLAFAIAVTGIFPSRN